MSLEIRARPRFLYTMHLPTKFHRPMFNRSDVIMLTNKQTQRDAAENIHLAPLRYAGDGKWVECTT